MSHSRSHPYNTHTERQRCDSGSLKVRLGTDSQLPFGYCSISIHPVDDPVVSPSGHIYSREAILQYLLNKMQEIKDQQTSYENQQHSRERQEVLKKEEETLKDASKFVETNDGVANVVKRKATDAELQNSDLELRKKKIDEKERDVKMEELKKVNYWITQFTPSSDPAEIKEPPKRPSSPFSGRPLRAKDLIPIELIRDSSISNNSSIVQFLCHVSKKNITNQKVILLKNTGALMIESVAQELAYPTMTCPITSKKFSKKDILEIVPAASAFSSSGKVEASKYRPTI